MNSFNSTGIEEGAIYNIMTLENKYLRVQGNRVLADGAEWNYSETEAQFFVDTGAQVLSPYARNEIPDGLLYRFRPVGQPNKYLYQQGSRIILEEMPLSYNFSDRSYNFIPISVNVDYMKFFIRSSNATAPLYMRTDDHGHVIIAHDSVPQEKAWFRLREVVADGNSRDTTAFHKRVKKNVKKYASKFGRRRGQFV